MTENSKKQEKSPETDIKKQTGPAEAVKQKVVKKDVLLCIACGEKQGMRLKVGIYGHVHCSECGETKTGSKISDFQKLK